MAAAITRRGLPALLAGGGGVLFGALVLINAGNLAFHALASQLLGPASYGALGSLLGVVLALSVPFSAVQVALVAEVARRREAGDAVRAGELLRRFAAFGLAVAAAMVAFAPALVAYLHLPGPAPILWLAAYLFPMALAVVPWACLCGQRRFGRLAAAVLAGGAVRMAVGAIVLEAGGGVAGAAAATFLGELTLAASLWLGARRWLRSGPEPALRLARRDALRGVGALAGLSILVGLDVVLARHYLPAAVAGTYVAAAITARGAMFLAQAATTVALPALSSADAARAGRALRATLAAGLTLGLLTTAGLALLADPLLPVVFGPAIQPSPALVLLLGAGATGAGMLGTVVQFHIAQRRRAAAAAWVGVVVLPLLAALSHAGPVAVATAALVAVALALVTALADGRRSPRPVRPAMAQPAPTSAADLDLTVVVPFHNPGDLLRPNLLNLMASLDGAGVDYEIIAVADCCTDGSDATISDLPSGRVHRLRLHGRPGKGEALRAGLREGRGRYLGFIDCDGDLDPALWEPFLALTRLYRPDAVIGSKRHPLSIVEASAGRRLCSWGYQGLAGALFRLPVGDTQVGIKLFRRELLVDVLPRTVEREFVFDLELLVAARRLGYRRLMEAPVTLRRGALSTIRWSTVATMLAQTAALAWRVHARGAYDGDPAADRRAAAPPVLAPRLPLEISG